MSWRDPLRDHPTVRRVLRVSMVLLLVLFALWVAAYVALALFAPTLSILLPGGWKLWLLAAVLAVLVCVFVRRGFWIVVGAGALLVLGHYGFNAAARLVLDHAVSAVRQDVAAVRGDVARRDAEIAVLKGKVGALQNKVPTLQAQVRELAAKDTAHERRLAELDQYQVPAAKKVKTRADAVATFRSLRP